MGKKKKGKGGKQPQEKDTVPPVEPSPEVAGASVEKESEKDEPKAISVAVPVQPRQMPGERETSVEPVQVQEAGIEEKFLDVTKGKQKGKGKKKKMAAASSAEVTPEREEQREEPPSLEVSFQTPSKVDQPEQPQVEQMELPVFSGAKPKMTEITRGKGRGREQTRKTVAFPSSPSESTSEREERREEPQIAFISSPSPDKDIITPFGRGRGRGRGRGKESAPFISSPSPDKDVTTPFESDKDRGRGKESRAEFPQHQRLGEQKQSEHPQETRGPKVPAQVVKEKPQPTSQPRKTQPVKKSPLDTVQQMAKSLPQSEGLLPPKRKDFGTLGIPIRLRANHFQVKFDMKKIIHHYDIDIQPAINTMKSLKRKVISEMTRHYPKVFGHARCVFDGEKNMYSNLDLLIHGTTFEVKWKEQTREKNFNVTVKKVAEVRLGDLQEFLEGRNRTINQTAIQALDIVMRHLSSMKYITIGRSVFPQTGGADLGGGVEMWRGFYQSLRPGQWKTLQLNLDVSNRSFYKEQSMLDFVCELFDKRIEELRRWNPNPFEKERLQKEVKGLKVEVIHTPIKRSYKIIGLSAKPAELQTFPLTTETGTQTCTVGKYFLDQYKKSLRYPNLPCLQAQPADKHRYLPMEVCHIPGGQQCKRLSDIQTASMIKCAATPAYIREKDIRSMVRTVNFQTDEYVKDFGLSFNDSLMQVEGRVLPSPEIKMKNDNVKPNQGVWDMRRSQFHEPVTIQCWGLLLFVDKRRFSEENIRFFTNELMKIGRNVGVVVGQPRFVEYCRDVRDVQPLFKQIQSTYKDVQLILVILPGKTPIYAEVKRCGDNISGISTQCVQMKNASKANPATLTNIFMKINAKLGGTNSIVQGKPISSNIFKRPVIILGADVTHPPAGDTTKPSIAAIIGSLDQFAVKYKAKICVQEHRVETITSLKDKVRDLLVAFYKHSRCKPEKIIFYRDGVGEGQFYDILRTELIAIRQACQSLEQDYKPSITFLVVQKRHHTRLFCDDSVAVGKSKNVPPGTTVDRAIVHPIENDFYLCSHQGIQGTSRPTHYHVLWDDSDFSADELQQLTYELCHTYVRCTRSVSIPSPAYYAHLAAFRARHHLENLQREYDRAGGDSKTWLEKMQKAVEIHENLGNMYFA